MDFNYFSEAPTQPFQLYGFPGEGSTGLSQSTTNDATPAFPIQIDNLVSTSSMLPTGFDYKFDAPLMHDNGAQPIVPQSHASPVDQYPAMAGGSLDSGVGLDFDQDMQLDRRASSEEKDLLTPAQSRRKAQNRAAQRAFRERKERHVRDLEAKLNLLTTTTSSLQSDNERLKALLQKTQSEVQQLRATTAAPVSPQTAQTEVDHRRSVTRTSTGGSSSSGKEHRSDRGRSSRLSARESFTSDSSTSPSGQAPMLSASAAWDLLQNHPRYTSGCVDVGKVCERLKTLAQCQGAGPMFDENEVRKILDEVGGNGADELI